MDDDLTRIGPYRVLQVLGEGGMGIVYEAEQVEPVRRRVALKVMKLGMDTKEVVARFEAERQALAVMAHPGIAQVFDGGANDEGRPYFVMELVKGVPLTEYCDARKLTLRERLALFVKVCQAVQHAHQKGVIHRDLKPSNVLVTEHDGTPTPKIIDFGIAKAVSFKLTEETLVTALGTAMGTLAYMSPEQAEMSTMDVDTRTDIYSLGVMLYELLAGTLPADPQDVGYQKFMMQLMTGHDETPRPSTRVRTAPHSDLIAMLRGTDIATLRRGLKGDLDHVILKAAEKDRNRRYETATALGADIERYLRNEPVEARAATAGYRLRKFVRRNRAGVVAAAVVALALVAGMVGTTTGLLRARAAEAAAEREAETARQVADFLTGLFAQSDPNAAGGQQLTARDLLDQGAVRIRNNLADRPDLQARLMLTMASAYRGLGALDPAVALFEEALATLERQGADDLEIARAKVQGLNILIDRGAFERAGQLGREALATFRVIYGEGYDHDVSNAVNMLAFRSMRSGEDVDEAEALLLALLAQQEAAGLAGPATAATMDGLCWTYLGKGDNDAADDMCFRTLALRRQLSRDGGFDVAVSLQRAGVVRRNQGRYAEALSHYREALTINTRLYGDVHPETAYNRIDLSFTFRAMNQLDSALAHARAAADIRRAVLSDDNPQRAEALFNLASVERAAGNVRASATVLAEALDVEERGLLRRQLSPVATTTGLIRVRARQAALRRQLGEVQSARREEARALRLIDSAVVSGIYGADVSALELNTACWWGALAGHGARIMPVCDAAVARSDDGNRPRIRDSRGVARAVAGDYAGAIEDFRAYIANPANVQGVPQRERWVEQLAAGQNPFTREELDRIVLP